ncbi:MAG: gliding motility-associated ABC transporter substrate-binding protein GldG [Chitinophagaceae bacterium]|nr:gliding motility-associated ABC transporter substrate-binding protein GldG [Chitinophagaceae bacterium]
MNVLSNILSSRFWLIPVIIGLAAVNWLASRFHTRLDLTNEKRFTLSTATKKILKKLDEPVTVEVFLKGDFPSGFKKLARSTEDVLQEFREVAGNKLTVRFIGPDEVLEGTQTSWGDTLTALGLYPINLKSQLKAGEQQQLVFPVALVKYKEKIQPVNLYSGNKTFVTPAELNSAEAMMEFKFADAIYKLTQSDKPMVAYSIGNGEPPVGSYVTYDLVENVLRPDYNLFTFNLNTQPVIPDTFKLLMIVKPSQPFSNEAKLKIDQFVMRGGKLLMLMDKLNAELDSLQSLDNRVVAYDRGLELNDLTFRYGARVNSDLLMDLQCDFLPFMVNGSDQMDYLHWNYFPLLESKSNHIINRNLGLVSTQFANSIDTVEAEGIRKTILLSSSAHARTISTPALISGSENVNAPEDDKFKKADIPVAVLLEGKFQSLFKNRLPAAYADSLAKYGGTFRPECLVDNKMIIIADGDMALNAVVKNEPLAMGMNRFTAGSQYQYPFANRDFIQNCLDYLLNTSGLLEAKSKDYTLRLLDKKKADEQRTTWQLLNIALPVLLLVLFALIYQWRRKRKYSR